MYDLNASNNEHYSILNIRNLFQKRKSKKYKSRDFRLHSIHRLRSVKLVCTSLEMQPASAAKPVVQGSTEETIGS